MKFFQRLHGKKDFEGTGIGLAMCKKILQNHHGHIYATSTEGHGLTFHILIPENQSCFADSSTL
ncbi:ATP-binding protein [Dyadobacter sp. BHUBP1]|uniref:ATP-binding protein n=1 Tax=Dyadobacter sp. BHUBP1 TaxID=3424178 RepID=UPI003D336964